MICVSGEVTVQDTWCQDISNLYWCGCKQSRLTISDLSKHQALTIERVVVYVISDRTGYDLCSVFALLNYLSRSGGKSGAFFQWKDNTPLWKTKSFENTWQGLAAAHLQAKHYAQYSFRTGAATTAAMAGLKHSDIQTCWKSSAYQLYIQTNPWWLGVNYIKITYNYYVYMYHNR